MDSILVKATGQIQAGAGQIQVDAGQIQAGASRMRVGDGQTRRRGRGARRICLHWLS